MDLLSLPLNLKFNLVDKASTIQAKCEKEENTVKTK